MLQQTHRCHKYIKELKKEVKRQVLTEQILLALWNERRYSRGRV